MPVFTLVEVIIIAIAYSFASFAIQRKVSNIGRMREIREMLNKSQRELNEMIKNKAASDEIKKKQDTIYPLLSESMKQQMKASIVVIPLFLLIYYVFIPSVFGIQQGTITFLSSAQNYQNMFIYTAIISSIVLLAVNSLIVRNLGHAKAKASEAAERQAA
jgi:uncharacterized membrane protein (DUF106 family)